MQLIMIKKYIYILAKATTVLTFTNNCDTMQKKMEVLLMAAKYVNNLKMAPERQDCSNKKSLENMFLNACILAFIAYFPVGIKTKFVDFCTLKLKNILKRLVNITYFM